MSQLERHRSRSPAGIRDERDYGRSGYGPRPRGGGRRGRYDRRGRGAYAGGAGSMGSRYSRFRKSKGDYGPVLARELDSTYDEKVNRNYANSVFVGNLTYDCTPEDLKDYFSQVGNVVRADIITSRGHHRGMGTVEFTNTEDVDEAIRRFDGAYFMDRQIFVRQDNPPPENNNSERVQERRRERSFTGIGSSNSGGTGSGDISNAPIYEVFVANLPYSVNWQALKDMFKECGNVIRADVELARNGYSRGFGTVIYGTPEEMQDAIARFHGYELEGRILEVREGRNSAVDESPPEPIDDSNHFNSEFTEGVTDGGERNCLIYCANLPFSTATSDLYDLFETIGKLNNAELRFDSEGAPTGVAIVEYENIEDADVCIDRLNNYNYGGCDLEISYGKRET
ncbi:mRNA-binding protein [Zygosaccharomyces mellis]|uniref:mRNA-binding protein n=1 Tax=Zygosaccharomyces mellis TaxID=42258 RepID=A0A4C2EB65_9SACH|nr:mRNA-binding protein [Zygosaccharomyces mellis]